MTRLAPALIVASLFVVLSACGGDGGPSVRLVLEADLSELPAGADPDEAMEDIAEILERRAEAFDAAIEVEVEGANRLSVRLRGADTEETSEVLGKTAQLRFLKPVLDEFRNVVCETEDGSSYDQMFLPDLFDVDPASNAMNCPPSEEGTAGVVLWEPATATDSQGEERVLTGGFLRPNADVVGPPSTVLIEFTGEGSLLFEQITTQLVGFPLAIFLDDELVAAPTVQQAITGGQATITGLDIDEARTLTIQLNAGALPVPMRVIATEEIP